VTVARGEDLSDGIYHLVPYMTFMKVFERWHHRQLHTQIGVDIFLGSVSPRDVVKERVELAETFLIFAPGIIFPWPPFYYFLDLERPMVNTTWRSAFSSNLVPSNVSSNRNGPWASGSRALSNLDKCHPPSSDWGDSKGVYSRAARQWTRERR
jgi:hypothetical protein